MVTRLGVVLCLAVVATLSGIALGQSEDLECAAGDRVSNPLGTCGCGGQLFMDEDCQRAFYCTGDEGDVEGNQGCLKTCTGAGEVIDPDFADGTWDCTEGNVCFGKFNLECEAVDVGATECDCANQLIIAPDCKSAYYCQTVVNGGGLSTCPDGQIIDLRLDSWGFRCKNDDGTCPGLGGYTIGCDSSSPTPPPGDFECSPLENNPIGECECDGQLFLETDCTRGFLCSDLFGSEFDGCLITCDHETEILSFDPLDGLSWQCFDREDTNFRCKGNFYSDCPNPANPNAFNFECECEGQYWQNQDCTEGFLCHQAAEDGEQNEGETIRCPDAGDIITNYFFYDDGSSDCTGEVDRCRGGFHYGCSDEDGGAAAKLADIALSLAAAVLVIISV